MINILEKIIVQKKKDLIQIKKKNSLNSIDAKIKSTRSSTVPVGTSIIR